MLILLAQIYVSGYYWQNFCCKNYSLDSGSFVHALVPDERQLTVFCRVHIRTGMNRFPYQLTIQNKT